MKYAAICDIMSASEAEDRVNIMIRNIVLDMGNVLLDYNPNVILDKVFENEEDKQIILKELFGGPEWVQGDLGIITNSERYDGVSRRVPERLHHGLKRCVEEWDICMIPVEGAKDFCRFVRERGYGMYVLSNACSMFYKYFPKYFPLEDFDGIVVSSDEHIVKPDRRIYEIILERYGLEAGECLFIDDRKDNTLGALGVGMNAHIFRNDYDDIIHRYGL